MAVKWAAIPAELIVDSGSPLRARAEVYACEGAETKFTKDFIAAWTALI